MERTIQMKRNIFLTGFMGAGKTTVGKVLAEKLNLKLIDTDEWIEKQYGKSISSIFSEEGEVGFRTYETKALNELPDEEMVVTTGGGIVMKSENRKIMREKGLIFYLHCEIEEILNRTKGDTTRPLLQNKSLAEVKELFNQRKNDYEDANYTIDTTGLSVTEIVEQIERILNETVTNGTH